MNRIRSILLLASLLLASSGVSAYWSERTVVVAGQVQPSSVPLHAPVAFCERLLDDAPQLSSPIYCEGAGLSATFADIGCRADFAPAAQVVYGDDVPDLAAGCLDDVDGSAWPVVGNVATDSDGIDNFAEGSVSVSYADGIPGAALALVANDRDDDGTVTTHDSDGSSDPDCSVQSNTGTAGEPGCHDDEFASGTTSDLETDPIDVGFCFTRDREFAGGDWDEFFVFVTDPAFVGSIPMTGSAHVELAATSYSFGCPIGTSRSGHTDEGYHGNGESSTNPVNAPAAGCQAQEPGVADCGAEEDPNEVGSINAKDAKADQHCVGGWSQIGVRGSYTGGTSTTSVRFWAECGGVLVIECTANPSSGQQCENAFASAPNGGVLRCYYSQSGGVPTSIQGECFDPIDPTGTLPAVSRLLQDA